MTTTHAGHVVGSKRPRKNNQKVTQAKRQKDMEKREQIARTDTPTKHKNTIHDLRQEKNKTKQKQAKQN